MSHRTAACKTRRWSRLVACGVFLATIGIDVAHAAAIDYAREERWAAEVAPAVVVGEVLDLRVPGREHVLAIVTRPAAATKGGIVLIHGLGVHPDFGVIGTLRTRLADAGYTTLSVQMPVLAAEATRAEYAVAMPEAGERIGAAIAYLRANGFERVAIVSHSLGASMANAYLARPDAAKIDAWVPVGMADQFAVTPREPVLDVVAEGDLPAVKDGAPDRSRALGRGCSRQITIAGADHYFERGDAALGQAIAEFLGTAFKGRC